MEKREMFLRLIQQALQEMERNQVVILNRGDLIQNDQVPLYREMHQEIKETENFIQEGGELKQGLRYLQLNVFYKQESFLMDLFETRMFPVLFELFEFE